MITKKFAVIVAGGTGSRMEAAIPKQFILLKGKPVLIRTIENFHRFDPQLKLIVVLPKNQFQYWSELCSRYNFELDHLLVAGGISRFESVQNGLVAIEGDGIVMIHDGVRPLVSHDTIERCVQMAIDKGNAIPALAVTESLRKMEGDGNMAVDRSLFYNIQTPQTFQLNLIRKAFEQNYKPDFTDDATVLEGIGEKINLVEGNRENIKITHMLDLKIAEAFLD